MSHNITDKDVVLIAALARLLLTSDELKTATNQLQGILDNFSTIQSIDTSSTPTSDDVTGLKNVTREDIPNRNSLSTPAELLDKAPYTKDGHIKVKAVFKK